MLCARARRAAARRPTQLPVRFTLIPHLPASACPVHGYSDCHSCQPTKAPCSWAVPARRCGPRPALAISQPCKQLAVAKRSGPAGAAARPAATCLPLRPADPACVQNPHSGAAPCSCCAPRCCWRRAAPPPRRPPKSATASLSSPPPPPSHRRQRRPGQVRQQLLCTVPAALTGQDGNPAASWPSPHCSAGIHQTPAGHGGLGRATVCSAGARGAGQPPGLRLDRRPHGGPESQWVLGSRHNASPSGAAAGVGCPRVAAHLPAQGGAAQRALVAWLAEWVLPLPCTRTSRRFSTLNGTSETAAAAAAAAGRAPGPCTPGGAAVLPLPAWPPAQLPPPQLQRPASPAVASQRAPW